MDIVSPVLHRAKDRGPLGGIIISRGNDSLNHLLFGDNLTIVTSETQYEGSAYRAINSALGVD